MNNENANAFLRLALLTNEEGFASEVQEECELGQIWQKVWFWL